MVALRISASIDFDAAAVTKRIQTNMFPTWKIIKHAMGIYVRLSKVVTAIITRWSPNHQSGCSCHVVVAVICHYKESRLVDDPMNCDHC